MATRRYTLMVAVLALASLTASGQVRSSFDLAPFTKMKLEFVGDIYISQGKTQSVTAEFHDTIVERRTKVYVKDNCLHIETKYNKNKKKIKKVEKGTIRIVVPTVVELSHDGVGDITFETPLEVDNLEFNHDGVGEIIFKERVEARGSIRIKVDGVGAFQSSNIDAGGALKLQNDGVGHMRTGNLTSRGELEVSTDGVGSLRCDTLRSEQAIFIKHSGVGSGNYKYVDAPQAKFSSTGVGSISIKGHRKGMDMRMSRSGVGLLTID